MAFAAALNAGFDHSTYNLNMVSFSSPKKKLIIAVIHAPGIYSEMYNSSVFRLESNGRNINDNQIMCRDRLDWGCRDNVIRPRHGTFQFTNHYQKIELFDMLWYDFRIMMNLPLMNWFARMYKFFGTIH